MERKHLIWQNYDLKIEDYDGCCDDWDEKSDEEKWHYIAELNNMYLDDERCNLNIQLDNPILVIASMGLWNGRRSGYKIIQSGNIKDIFYADGEYAEWFSDGHNVKGRYSHHDGTNYMEYREIKDMDKIDALLADIYNGVPVKRSKINYYTKSIAPSVNKVYGW